MKIKTLHYNKNKSLELHSFANMDSSKTLIFAFFSPHFAQESTPFKTLKQAFPTSKIIGCSTSGEIFNNQVNDESISIAIIQFEHTDIRVAYSSVSDNVDSLEIGKNIANELNSDSLRAVFILSEGLTVNASRLLEGLKNKLPSHIVVTGGLAGDGKDFKKTYILKDTHPTTQAVCAVGLYGDKIDITYGSKGGWDIFGPERLITRSKENVLFEIDGEPALTLYKKYLGERAKELPASGLLFPLAISENPFGEQVVRTILSVDEKEQSMTFAGNIPQGWYAQLMRANFDRLIEGASDAAKQAVQPHSSEKLVIAISCVGRRLILGERIEEEVDAALESFDNKTELIGFYSYGEISPSGISTCDLHNQTMTITTFAEQK